MHSRFAKLAVCFALVTAVTVGLLARPALAQDRTIVVFAAASMKNALDEVSAVFAKATGVKVTASYAATSALVKQIEQGAPADIFVSADTQWMDYAVEKKLVQPGTRVDLLGNRLVLIAPLNSKLQNVPIGQGFDIAALAGDGRIAVGDVTAVPAGRYAKAALVKLDAWPAAEKKLAMVENVRVALTLVARGEAVLGIVYETDAKVEPNVRIVGRFPDGSHPPVVYPVAATASTSKPDADAYLRFLRTQGAKAIFERYGFSFLIRPTS